ncbi:hypothetical protein EW146_g948 [Bondarzewia mesenterica]|uniref:Pseudouridine synthase RsuA/RluA-like domain-containing protein n=1 Tax=Bondarzewia mesenterica TaxID=1095465 RepID=A0A4V3XG87_9AGAM|nr:hypothetical protein EW146_g948 [Bondarzewia mesenterica]
MSIAKQLPLAALPKRNTRASSLGNVLYVDRGILVLNKWSGLVSQGTLPADSDTSHRDKFKGTATEFDTLLSHLKKRYNVDAPLYPVHRLDKRTTGALVLCKNPNAATQLSQQFKTREVSKTYLALVRGGEKTFPTRQGQIDKAIKIDDGRVSMSGSQKRDSKPALTTWELLASSPKAPISLLRMQLHTGLKHQLRVHTASALKAPILGDTLYGSAKLAPQISAVTSIPDDRVFLHASEVSFFVRLLSLYSRSNSTFLRGILRLMRPRSAIGGKDHTNSFVSLESDAIRGGVYVDDVRVEDGEVPDMEGKWLAR